MKRAWIENNQIFMTEDDTLVIPTQWVEVPENVSFEQLKIENNQIVFKSEQELLQEEKQKKLRELKAYIYSELSKTDWVVVKCLELGLDMAQAYPEVKQQRDALRALNATLEQEIENAKTNVELSTIELEQNIEDYKRDDVR